MKRSVHLTADSENYILNRSCEQSNFSAHINSAFEQLAHLSRAEKPELSNEEWVELYNVYAGSDLTRLPLPINLAADLLAHYGATVPAQTPCAELVNKIASMSQAQQFAIIDAVRVYWVNA